MHVSMYVAPRFVMNEILLGLPVLTIVQDHHEEVR